MPPQNFQEGILGSNASFSVTADGSTPLSYQWQFNGTNLPGATNTTLVISNLTTAATGSYIVIVTNQIGSVTSMPPSLLVVVPPFEPGGCDPTPAGLISWWRAEGNASDSIGTNNGILVNSPNFAPGEVGQAFSFNAANQQFVQVEDSPSLEPASVTLECWFNASNNVGQFVGKPLGGQDKDSYAVGLGGGGLLYGVICSSSVHGPFVLYPFNPVPGIWYHIAYTFDSASQVQVLYLNGTLVASNSAGGIQMGYDAHPLLIGADNDDNSNVLLFTGEIDEVGIYGRALSADEIAVIYEAGSAGKCSNDMPAENTPPVLPVLATQTVNELAPLTVTNTAKEPNIYAASAGYALVDPPGGMTINSNGIISWTPGPMQGPGTNIVTTVVTNFDALDALNPILAATNSFVAVVFAPILNPITHVTVNAGQPVSSLASATDNDSSRQLTFGLGLAPAGAAINLTNGLFNWRPPVSSAGSSNNIQVVVTADSVPSVSVTQSFAVLVNPLTPTILTPVSMTNASFTMQADGPVGPDYTLLTSKSLIATNWTILLTNTPFVSPFVITDTNASTATNSFYRLKLGP